LLPPHTFCVQDVVLALLFAGADTSPVVYNRLQQYEA
jgi:hypothetical protein